MVAVLLPNPVNPKADSNDAQCLQAKMFSNMIVIKNFRASMSWVYEFYDKQSRELCIYKIPYDLKYFKHENKIYNTLTSQIPPDIFSKYFLNQSFVTTSDISYIKVTPAICSLQILQKYLNAQSLADIGV